MLQFLLIFFLCFVSAFAQTTKTDSTKKTTTQVDTTVSYKADLILHSIKDDKTYLLGNAFVSYKTMTIEAHKITVNWKENSVFAEGKTDTIYSKEDSAKFTAKLTKTPIFRDSGERIDGETFLYNFKSKRGKVLKGKTKLEDAFYVGENIVKGNENTLFVKQGDFTTCELDTPHYYFRTNKMKMLYKDKIIARPVYLYIHEVPIFALPFAVIPTNTERRSGIIPPSYAETTKFGRELRELGIYFAPNDFMDFLAVGTLKEKSGIETDWKFTYAKRYVINTGLVYGNFSQRESNPFERTTFWSLGWKHNQNVRQKGIVDVDLYYEKNNPIRELSPNLQDRLAAQKIRSSASYEDYLSQNGKFKILYENEKSFQGNDLTSERTKFPSLNFTYKTYPFSFLAEKNTSYQQGLKSTETQTLPSITGSFGDYNFSYLANQTTNFSQGEATKITRSSYPRISFSKRSLYFFGSPKIIEGKTEERSWYKELRLSGNNFTFERYKEQNSDTTLNVWKNETHKGLVYSSSIGIAPKFNYFSLTPTFSYKADFVERFQKGTLTKTGSGTDSVAIAFEKGNKVRQTFSSALAVSTKIYGIRQVGFWKIEQVRHVVDPSVTFTYAPDFSKKTWNYFQEVKNDSGRVVQKVDKFGGNKTSVIGATSTNKTRRLDFSLGNKFQMKYFSGDSTRKQEKKIDLFDLNFSSSYNFEADSLKLGNLRTVFTAKPSQKITTTANTTHTFYAFNSKKYLFETSPSKVANLVNFSLDLQFLLSGGELQNFNQSNVFTKQDTSRSFETATSPQTHDKSGNLILRNKAIENLRVPWTLNSHLTWGMNRNERKGGKFTKDSQLIVSVASQLTPNWAMSYDATYDLVNQIIRSHEFNFVRTLHKWKLGFRWIPYGFGAGYFLKVGLDSPQLKDLKIQTHEGENLRDPF